MVRSHQMKHMLRRKPMTCVSTARLPKRQKFHSVLLATETVDTKQPLCSHIGTLCIHPRLGHLLRTNTW